MKLAPLLPVLASNPTPVVASTRSVRGDQYRDDCLRGKASNTGTIDCFVATLPRDDEGESACPDELLDEQELEICMPRGLVAPLLSLCTGDGEPLTVAVTTSGREAENLAAALSAYVPADSIDIFPSWETLPHERLSPRSDTVARRLRLARRLAHPDEFPPLRLLVMPVRALLQPIAAGLGDIEPVRIECGSDIDLGDVLARLSEYAYKRVDMIEGRGQFAVRGGILDIFPPTEDHPVRLELFGDTVEEIRAFSVSDQRSLAELDEVYAPPCREILLSENVRERARAGINMLPAAADMLDKIAEGIYVEGMESLAPLLVEEMIPVLDMLPANARICLIEPERIEQRAENLLETASEFLAAAWSGAAAGGSVPLDVDAASFATLEDTRTQALDSGRAWWKLAGLPRDDENIIHIPASEPVRFLGKVEEAIADIKAKSREAWRIVIVMSGEGQAQRMARQLEEADVPASYVGALPDELTPSVAYVCAAPVTAGFVAPKHKLALFTGKDILGREGASTRDMRAMPKRRKGAIVDPLSLKPGDFIVHERHGVGRFVRMDKRSIGAGSGTRREYLVVEYAATKRGAPPDQLWIPTDQLNLVSRYTGGEIPKLNKMGGADWQKTKAKARAATRHIAAELLRLYAERLARPGFAFSPDTPWQRELEDAFEYVETPDQLTTIGEVKADMEKPVPMDRLISGDVGYGKTEIAVRAAFKAVQDSKQVAVLVPTTLLVSQHFETFRERYASFPVRLAALSRFQSPAEARKTIDGLASGEIDVVIGTHRLLTGEVRFKNLGLVIIDEEQRFGVEHKETLTQMYPGVDVLAMSATPIPRTLEMAVTGVREMSTLATPPEERHPVLTYVGRREDKQISAAIRRELLRDGQVFFVHNRVSDIPRVASRLASLVPEARIGVAHGKMGERELEQVINDFWEKELDVLVCTTIIETGLDISNANTLIVENAERFGLSQLHQLRGRVGRGRERAYAYFLYNPERSMTQTALERLQTIAANTDLGSGIQVAMKDLEIRGAGTMLGSEQSGNIEGVGFDLYVRMIGEAVERMRGKGRGGVRADDGEDAVELSEIRIELPVEAYLPESYIPSERLRLEMYQKIAGACNEAEREEVREELRDRYGEIGEEVERLFAIGRLRELCARAGISEVTMMGQSVRLAPVALPDSRQARLKRLYPASRLKPAIRALIVPTVRGRTRLGEQETLENEALLDWLTQLITSVFLDNMT
ncbi:MAG: transcription-repair coupling factor [Actinomycetaceae bacterium]|nr:transcription-repair coupling factor [Actinomycetaceae bacterium]